MNPDKEPYTNAAIIAAWEQSAHHSLAIFTEEGDFARQHLLNPAIFALLGDVAGKRVLDAGCGNGYLCRLLARRGAHVTGVEPATPFVQYALERDQSEQLGITYLQRDISLLDDIVEAFDAIVSNMVLMDIPDYERGIRNCVRALKPGGTFVFSLAHPCFEERGPGFVERGAIEVQEYLAEYPIAQTYTIAFHRPLSSYINLVADAGCTIQRMLEPQLAPELVEEYPHYRRDAHIPSYIVIAARKS